MQTSFNGYQRLIVKGIPTWKKEDALYLYETDVGTNPVQIGTVSGGFAPTWLEKCDARLESYRSSVVSRQRSTAPPKKK